jgi:glycosyltransferase involved in cell wall biosynthesis
MKIAYLAPEIPALSATFVYNEMIALERLGHIICPISVHRPKSEAKDERLQHIRDKVLYLYSTSKFKILYFHLLSILHNPINFFSVLKLLISDIARLGYLNKAVLGQIYRFIYSGYVSFLLKKLNVEHLHVHFAHVPTDIAMYASKLAGIGFSVTAHANDIFERGYLIKAKVERAEFFATISEFNRSYLIKNKKANPDKVKVIRCGVDLDEFTIESEPQARRNNKLVIGTLGRLVEKKGIDTLIKSLKYLDHSEFEYELNIAGDGPLENELKQLIDENKIKMPINFVGALSHEEVPNYLKSLDVFVLACKKDSNGDMDGIPVVLMEAMVLGVPVISTQLSGIPELVIDKLSGRIVQPNSELELAKAIRELAVDESLINNVIQGAQDKVKKEFSLMGNAEILSELISSH